MSKMEKNKSHLREIMLFLFNSKKSAAEAHRMLIKAYGENCIGKTTCRDWFRRFKSGDLDVQDKERPGQIRKFEDVELEALLHKNPCSNQKDLAFSLGVSQATISTRLKVLGVIKKQINSSNDSPIPKHYIFKGREPPSKRKKSNEE